MPADRLTRLLNPRSVAVVGAKRANDYRWLRCVSTFQGPVYSVNIDPTESAGIEALGVRNYPRLLDIPGPLDYVIVSVPREVVQMAREAGLPLVGPNCMGVFNPKIGLRNFPELYAGESGPIGFLSQSGTHAYNFALMGYLNGLKVSK